MKYSHFFIFTLITLSFFQCNTKADSQNNLNNINQSNINRISGFEKKIEEPELLDDYFVKKDFLSFNGYDVIKLKKNVKLDYPSEMKSDPASSEVSYAVLKKNNKSLKTFDGVYSGAGNATNFGLFPFLGKDSNLLAVSQTIPRGGRHWVVDLSAEPSVIFDSKNYGVGREEFSVIDIDKDGIYEISMPLTDFYMFENMSMAETPLPEIFFKYDEKTKKYLPANRMFQDYLLNGIEDEIKQLNSKDENRYLSDRLDIVLRYIYAGKEETGWAFFDKEYTLPNKEEIKSKINSTLKNEKIYKYLYKN